MIPGIVAAQGVYAAEPPPGPVLWTPAAITTALWLDAADTATLTLDGSDVSGWADKSGNSRHATRSSTTRPEISAGTLNGLDEISFNGSTQYFDIAGGLPVTQNMGVFVVFRRSAAGVLSLALGGSAANSPPYGVLWFTDNVRYSALNAGASFNTHGSSSSATGAFLSSLVRDASNVELWVNGTTSGGPQSAFSVSGASALAYIGRRGSNYHNGRIAEIVVAPSANRQVVEGYLAHKWGLAGSLPGGHPYKDDPPYV